MTADGSAITHQAFLLKHSNGLWDSLDWLGLLPANGHMPRSIYGSVHSKPTSLHHLVYQAPDLFSRQQHFEDGQMHLSLTDGSVSIQMQRTESSARPSGDGTSMCTRLGAGTACRLS